MTGRRTRRHEQEQDELGEDNVEDPPVPDPPVEPTAEEQIAAAEREIRLMEQLNELKRKLDNLHSQSANSTPAKRRRFHHSNSNNSSDSEDGHRDKDVNLERTIKTFTLYFSFRQRNE